MSHEDNLVIEENIRTQAYLLWEQDGKPQGDGLEYWLQAESAFIIGSYLRKSCMEPRNILDYFSITPLD